MLNDIGKRAAQYGVLLIALLVTGPTNAAERSQNWTWCANEGAKFSPDLQIGGCTALIQSGRETHKNLAIAFNNRGNAYLSTGAYNSAITDYTESIRLNPRYSFPHNNRGFAYYRQQKYDLAIADFSKAIEFDPNYATAFYNRALAYAAGADQQPMFVPDPQTGDILFNPGTGKNPKTGQSIFNAQGIAHKNEEHQRAVADYSAAMRIDTKFANPHTYFNRAQSEIEVNQPDAALKDYDQAIKLVPKFVAAYLQRANLYRYRKKDFASEIADYEQAIRIDSTLVEKQMVDGNELAYDPADYDHAIAAYTEAIKSNPAFPGWYKLRGDIYRQKWDDLNAHVSVAEFSRLKAEYSKLLDQAIADYSELIRLAPDHEAPYMKRAYCYERNDDDVHAIADYSEDIRINPRSVEAYRKRADLYRFNKQFDQAIADLTEAIRMQPNRDTYLARAWSFEGKKDYAQAILDYTSAIQLNPQNPDLFLSRGNAYLLNGDIQHATSNYTEASRLEDAAALEKAPGQQHPRLGVRLAQVTDDFAKVLHLQNVEGALIVGTMDNSPARSANIETLDVILTFDGKQIKTTSDLQEIVSDTPDGKEVQILLMRQGKLLTKTARIGR